jgi:beta-glucanase (GH16 family)
MSSTDTRRSVNGLLPVATDLPVSPARSPGSPYRWRMPRVRFVRFSVLAGVAGLAVLTTTLQPSAPVAAPSSEPQLASAWVPPNPTNAGKIFRWGNKQWGDEFKTALASTWQVSRPGLVRNQHGMLTLDTAGTGATVYATYTGHNRTYGRWEARVRGRQYGTGGQPYTVHWELVPSSQPYHCGAGNLTLSQFTLGKNTAEMHVRNLPGADFSASRWMYLSDNEFHTFAVEVTPDHVSWFVDTKVIRTERRPAALAGVPLMPRFRVQGVDGAKMNRGRMQMDWMRYYTLARKNAKPITAPQLTQSTNTSAC